MTTQRTITSIYIDGSYIIAGGTQASVSVWDINTLGQVATFHGPLTGDQADEASMAEKNRNIAGAVKSGKKEARRSATPLTTSISQFIPFVSRRGDYIIGSLENSILIWSMATKQVSVPIKVRRTQGRIVTQLGVAPNSFDIIAVIARKKRDEPQLDVVSWTADDASLSKAAAKIEKSQEYERSIGLALSREVTDQLLTDPAFLHRMFKVTLDDSKKKADPGLSGALLRIGAARGVIPFMLEVALDESISALDDFQKNTDDLMRSVSTLYGRQMPSPTNVQGPRLHDVFRVGALPHRSPQAFNQGLWQAHRQA
jgi:hypothetical protein